MPNIQKALRVEAKHRVRTGIPSIDRTRVNQSLSPRGRRRHGGTAQRDPAFRSIHLARRVSSSPDPPHGCRLRRDRSIVVLSIEVCSTHSFHADGDSQSRMRLEPYSAFDMVPFTTSQMVFALFGRSRRWLRWCADISLKC